MISYHLTDPEDVLLGTLFFLVFASLLAFVSTVFRRASGVETPAPVVLLAARSLGREPRPGWGSAALVEVPLYAVVTPTTILWPELAQAFFPRDAHVAVGLLAGVVVLGTAAIGLLRGFDVYREAPKDVGRHLVATAIPLLFLVSILYDLHGPISLGRTLGGAWSGTILLGVLVATVLVALALLVGRVIDARPSERETVLFSTSAAVVGLLVAAHRFQVGDFPEGESYWIALAAGSLGVAGLILAVLAAVRRTENEDGDAGPGPTASQSRRDFADAELDE